MFLLLHCLCSVGEMPGTCIIDKNGSAIKNIKDCSEKTDFVLPIGCPLNVGLN